MLKKAEFPIVVFCIAKFTYCLAALSFFSGSRLQSDAAFCPCGSCDTMEQDLADDKKLPNCDQLGSFLCAFSEQIEKIRHKPLRSLCFI